MPRGRDLALAALCALWSGSVTAGGPETAGRPDPVSEPVPEPVPYALLAERLEGRVDFEDRGAFPEPGIAIRGLYRVQGAALGGRFAGQTRVTRAIGPGLFDALTGQPAGPLRLEPDDDSATLSLATHRGLGSVAAFPLGPRGFPDIGARGEGALAVLFDAPQRATGFRLHADYADPLGTRPPPGAITVTFHAADGSLLGAVTERLAAGPLAFGWRFAARPVAGFTLTTTDPGGIAIDDILFDAPPPTS